MKKNYIKKINDYRKENGSIKTLKWVYNCALYKIRVEKSIKRDFYYQNIEKNGFIKKQNKRVFIFATIPFYDIGGGQRSAQFAKIFNKIGYEVFYIYAFKSSDSTNINIENPCVLHLHIDDININEFEALLSKDDIVIFEAPCIKFIPFFEIAKKANTRTVYENIDNWENQELGGMIFSEDALKLLITESSLITCTAKPLLDQMKKYQQKYKSNKKVLYLPNAVDDELFNARKQYDKPADLKIGTKTLLYYGSLWGTWFNWDVIFQLAEKNPDIAINLIGDYNGIKEIVDKAPENVYFLGLKKQIDLPSYLKYSDFAILPFYSDDIGKYVSPLKIFEYIAMNKKVISSPLPDIQNYPNVIYANNFDEWNKALNDNKKINETASEKFTFQNNWHERIDEILDNINPEESKINKTFNSNLSIVVLNYNNSNVIFRCIDTLIKFNKRYNYEIIVVDNKSSDGSYEKLMKEYNNQNNVKIIRNSKNGCSSGRNLGVKKSTKEYIMFLDSDEWITNAYWLDNYLSLIKEYGDKTVIGWGAGWFNKKLYAYHVVDSFPHRYLEPNYLATSDIGYLATCGFIINKDFFNEIGGFDENYDPTCYEDTDLSLAVRFNGGEIFYCKYLGVGHLPHQTTKSGTKEHEQLIMKKGQYFIKKWTDKNKNLIKNYIK